MTTWKFAGQHLRPATAEIVMVILVAAHADRLIDNLHQPQRLSSWFHSIYRDGGRSVDVLSLTSTIAAFCSHICF